jgi:hypothetical protein
MARAKKPIVAFCYDFDGTLAPGNLQEHSFIPNVGLQPAEFWAETKKIAREANADPILVYMHQMIEKARAARKPVRRADFQNHGRGVRVFDGLDTWFDRIEAAARELGLSAEHYVISSGNLELIEACSIGDKFTRIFASSFMYDVNDVAIWPALAINYTTKTQFLFRINKGTLDPWDNSKINDYIPPEKRRVPFSRMIFIGDGETDIPCMKLVTDHGGYAIAVYTPKKSGARTRGMKLIEQKRARFVASADYSDGSELDKIVQRILAEIGAREALRKLEVAPGESRGSNDRAPAEDDDAADDLSPDAGAPAEAGAS